MSASRRPMWGRGGVGWGEEGVMGVTSSRRLRANSDRSGDGEWRYF